ncbi:MAG TPA: hypothetical protein VHM93_19820 [Candidatus Acidoferrum sp.]|jgi:hypothetical protein|nr:hypothetical protein [Candidatus Acidoferrum sp.]
MPSSAHVAVTTTKGSALPIGRQSRIKEDTVPRSGTALFAICILLWISFIGARRIARQVAIPFVVRRSPARCTLDPTGTSAVVVTCPSGKVSHTATAQLTVN